VFHVCGRCPRERGFPGRPFPTFRELRAHMLDVHGKEPEARQPPPEPIDLRFLT
jgi:hypothetical protein